MPKMTKVSVCVLREHRKQVVHFCYCEHELMETLKAIKYCPNTKWVAKWAKKDFNIINFTTYKDVVNLRNRILMDAEDKYPDIFLSSSAENDPQGWVRVWLKQHVKDEIRKHFGRDMVISELPGNAHRKKRND